MAKPLAGLILSIDMEFRKAGNSPRPGLAKAAITLSEEKLHINRKTYLQSGMSPSILLIGFPKSTFSENDDSVDRTSKVSLTPALGAQPAVLLLGDARDSLALAVSVR